MPVRDVIVIGGGHNGLSLGCYLAKAGLDVAVLERRAEMGGGLSTEEATVPGFYHNLHSNFHGAMPFFPPWVDLDLEAHGATYIHPSANIGMPLRDGRSLVLYVDELESYEQVARFSKKDADSWLEMRGIVVTHLEEMLSSGYTPPVQSDVAQELVREQLHEWFGEDIVDMSAVELVRSRFENPHVQALILFHMAVGGWDVRQPRSAALALPFFGYITNWQLCRGGSHHLAHVLGTVFLKAGGHLEEHSDVARIRTREGRAIGVTLADGTEIDARLAVVSTVDPHQTYLRFLEESDLPAGLGDRVRQVRYGHGDVLFGVHLALDEAPRFTAAGFNPDIDRTFNLNIGYETPEDLLEHYEEIDRNELPETPRLEVGFNTLFDPSQAPEGKHTAVLWQFVPFAPGHDDEGSAVWNDLKQEYAERCIAAVRTYAPNLTPDRILGTYAYTPHDIAGKMINMRRGGFHCAAVLEEQLFDRRPLGGGGGIRTPIEGLYMGGASVHPHGGIIAAPAYNCLQVLADDHDLWGRLPLRKKIWDDATRVMRERLAARGVGR